MLLKSTQAKRLGSRRPWLLELLTLEPNQSQPVWCLFGVCLEIVPHRLTLACQPLKNCHYKNSSSSIAWKKDLFRLAHLTALNSLKIIYWLYWKCVEKKPVWVWSVGVWVQLNSPWLTTLEDHTPTPQCARCGLPRNIMTFVRTQYCCLHVCLWDPVNHLERGPYNI